jgi:hypothetical protein
MAVDKAIRSNSPAQPQPHALVGGPEPQAPKPERPNANHHQLKAEIFDVLRHLNRGYGVALAALDKLESKDRRRGAAHLQEGEAGRVFPEDCLRDFRHRTEALRAQANHDLQRLMAVREQRDAAHFGRSAKTAKRYS